MRIDFLLSRRGKPPLMIVRVSLYCSFGSGFRGWGMLDLEGTSLAVDKAPSCFTFSRFSAESNVKIPKYNPRLNFYFVRSSLIARLTYATTPFATFSFFSSTLPLIFDLSE